ncbi:MAG: alpha-amylase [Planctomycetes bacterium]|nr:alpha-amylase [Planctomycetota bacterium]
MERHPFVHQVNARLRIPRGGFDAFVDEELDRWADLGFDFVWPMGVWRSGERGWEIAVLHGALYGDYDEACPDWSPVDIGGSPYAIAGYELADGLGGFEALDRFRARLKQRGMGLLLDFVPNHTGFDHPWTREHPEYFVRLPQDVAHAMKPEARTGFPVRTDSGDHWIAHGKDPYFAPWTDTAQLDYGRRIVRDVQVEQLLSVARHCDGVRCDMAMLVLDDVRRQTWGDLSREDDEFRRGAQEFWSEAIQRVQSENPGFLFLAEVYWNLERRLVSLGFDHAYDKGLYDALVGGSADAILGALADPERCDRHWVRFLENHDEPRAAVEIPLQRHLAAALLTFTLPGVRLIHEGQMEGRRIKWPVQIIRAVEEAPDEAVRTLYERLLHALHRRDVREGRYERLPARQGEDDVYGVVVQSWSLVPGERCIAVVNLTHEPRLVEVPSCSARGDRKAHDLLSDERFHVVDGPGQPSHVVPLAPFQGRFLCGPS